MLKTKDYYALSDYPKHHKYFDETNKKVIGKFKDEACGNVISEFVGLRAKMYSQLTYITNTVKEEDKNTYKPKRTAKGIKKRVNEKENSHDKYRQCLFE